ncbi:MAG: ABC transporter substrate-binding protein, partial [Methanophagales archaeon]|nr:ABC transporter substrate-binding protein [Methanophagales archaeon]
IIVGKEKELTVVDSADRTVTVKKPIVRIVVLHVNPGGIIQVLNARDKVVGVGTSITQRKVNYPELSKLPSVGTEDYEAILNLNPDLVLAFLMDRPSVPCMEHLPDSIPVVGLNVNRVKTMSEEFKKMGYILDKKDEAKEFINLYKGYIDEMNERTEEFSEDEKPRVFFSFGSRWFYSTDTTSLGGDIAGGKNIAVDLPGGRFPQVDPEWVIEQNPDIIIVGGWGTPGGYNTDDPSGMKDLRESVINRPELANVNAVKNGRVYAIHFDTLTGPDGLMGMIYYAKWFYPDIFKDWDPQAIHQEFLDRFKRIDFNAYEHGVFVYHPEEHPDGK